MTNLTDVYYNKDDIGKNLYKKKTYYTLQIEDHCLAKDQDEADAIFSDSGLNHNKITTDLVDSGTKGNIECNYIDANYSESGNTEFMGKVKYDDDSYHQTLEEAVENEDVHIDTYADETEPLQNIDFGTKEESEVDVSLNLEAESAIGK